MAGPICIYTLFLYIMCTSDCVAASLLADCRDLEFMYGTSAR